MTEGGYSFDGKSGQKEALFPIYATPIPLQGACSRNIILLSVQDPSLRREVGEVVKLISVMAFC